MVSCHIRYLATGESISSLHEQFRMGKSTLDKLIPQTLHILSETLQPFVLKMPETQEGWQQIIDEFAEKWQFPHCWRALDGKHVVMQGQPHSSAENFNHKWAHSINLLALCDANYKFIAVDIGARGRQSDGSAFRPSNLGRRLFARTLNLPPPTELYPGGLLVPQFCVADEAFSLDISIMRPYPERSSGRMPNDQRVFNYRLSRARRVIENTFGIMLSQWRIFRSPINVTLKNIKLIVLAAVCLHNYIRQKEKNLPEDMQHYCPANLINRVENGVSVEEDMMEG